MERKDCWRCGGSGQIQHPHHVGENVDCPSCAITSEEQEVSKIENAKMGDFCPFCLEMTVHHGMLKGGDELLWVYNCTNCNFHIEYPVVSSYNVADMDGTVGEIIAINKRKPINWNESQGEIDYSLESFTIRWKDGAVHEKVCPEAVFVMGDIRTIREELKKEVE